MAYEFTSLAEVEALPEVPENATVLAEVGGSIKRVPGNGLGGGKSLIITRNVVEVDPNAVSEGYIDNNISANMTFEEAFAAFNAHELTSACLYLCDNNSNPPVMFINLYIADISNTANEACLSFVDGSGMNLFWVSAGFTLIGPGNEET